jgi:hypothetical protein
MVGSGQDRISVQGNRVSLLIDDAPIGSSSSDGIAGRADRRNKTYRAERAGSQALSEPPGALLSGSPAGRSVIFDEHNFEVSTEQDSPALRFVSVRRTNPLFRTSALARQLEESTDEAPSGVEYTTQLEFSPDRSGARLGLPSEQVEYAAVQELQQPYYPPDSTALPANSRAETGRANREANAGVPQGLDIRQTGEQLGTESVYTAEKAENDPAELTKAKYPWLA